MLLKRVLPGLAVALLAVGCAQESSQEPSRQDASTTQASPTTKATSTTQASPTTQASRLIESAQMLIESAVDVCSAEEVYPIGCAPASWHACLAQQEETARGADRYLCNAAVLAETGELAFALAYRYGKEFYPYVFINVNGQPARDVGLPVFSLFWMSLDYWAQYFASKSYGTGFMPCAPYCGYRSSAAIDLVWSNAERGTNPFGGFYSEASETDLAPPMTGFISCAPYCRISDPIDVGWLTSARDLSAIRRLYPSPSGAERALLGSLRAAIFGLFSPYSAYSPSEPDWHVNSPDLSSFEAADPTASSLVPPAEVVRVCQDAMTAARLGDPMWRTGIQQCLASAEACGKDDDAERSFRGECSEVALAADFESRWQMLPYVCLAAGKATDMDSPDDPCREAAEELCYHPHRRYQGFSPREQPDSPAEDFTCAAGTVPIARADRISGGQTGWIRTDVLANDFVAREVFDRFTLDIVESERPRRGTARVTHIPQGLPVIEYRASRFFSADERDTFTYAICDDRNRCDSAEVTVVFPKCTITGTPGNDTLRGTGLHEVICGMDGDDTIYGGDRGDTIYGGTGNDTIYGRDHYDTIYGGDGGDTIYGGTGNDTIYGERGDDTLYGDEGRDTIFGGQGNDTIYGGDGDDTIRGNAGADTVDPGPGNNTILGASEEDVIL